MSQAILIRVLSTVCVLLLVVPFGNATTKQGSKTSSKAVTSKSKSSAKASHSSASKKSAHGKKKAKRTSKKSRGQQAIDSERAREIQSALIREHYLQGDPSGVWDAQTKAALTKFQSDNGWQSRVLPDSRALIKLGLGPSKDGLLNPESAAIGNAHELGAEKVIPGGAEPHR